MTSPFINKSLLYLILITHSQREENLIQLYGRLHERRREPLIIYGMNLMHRNQSSSLDVKRNPKEQKLLNG